VCHAVPTATGARGRDGKRECSLTLLTALTYGPPCSASGRRAPVLIAAARPSPRYNTPNAAPSAASPRHRSRSRRGHSAARHLPPTTRTSAFSRTTTWPPDLHCMRARVNRGHIKARRGARSRLRPSSDERGGERRETMMAGGGR